GGRCVGCLGGGGGAFARLVGVTSSLTITRYPYEEPHHLHLVVRAATHTAATDTIAAEQEIYANATDLEACAAALRGFPRHVDDAYSWELGSERPEDRFAFYFRLSFRCLRTDTRGPCVVQIRFCNNRGFPERRVAEFAFGATPADLDRLGDAFAQFAKLKDPTLTWVVDDDPLAFGS
ncbi:MAG: hypothetical protein AB8H80_12325, partial [Planctomycetota bacterium]